MPPDTGMGFLVVTHLDPTHDSLMPDLLQKHTEMKVTFVR
jgi:two-component system, chemotaxis family, CheB/CheR fusion protein